MEIEWDETKRATNVAKHGLDFPLAEQVLANDPAVFEDLRKAYDERRFNAVGPLDNGLLVSLIFTPRAGRVRIISLRKASPKERRFYEQSR